MEQAQKYRDLPQFWMMVEQVKAEGKIEKATLETTKKRQRPKYPDDNK